MATNPYTSVTITGYNSSPPSDDGAQTEANKIKWSTQKTKLSDPLNTGLTNVNANTLSAFGALVITTEIDEESAVLAYTNYARR